MFVLEVSYFTNKQLRVLKSLLGRWILALPGTLQQKNFCWESGIFKEVQIIMERQATRKRYCLTECPVKQSDAKLRKLGNLMSYTYVRTCFNAPWDANEAEMSLIPAHLLPNGGWFKAPCFFAFIIWESRPYGHLSPGQIPCKTDFLLVWLKKNFVAQGIILLIASENTFLRETIASRNSWNMTHDKMEIADSTEDRPNLPRQSRESF